MNRRTIVTILSAVALALLVGFIWFMFFRGGTPAPANNGSFGTGQNKPASTGGSTGIKGNIPSNVLPAGSEGTAGAGSVSGGGSGATTDVSLGTVGNAGGVASVPGVDWLGGTSAGSGGGPVSNFVPATVNSLNQGAVSGSPNILPGSNVTDSDGNLLGAALLGVGIGAALCTAGFISSGAAGGAATIANRVTAVPVADAVTNIGTVDTAVRENFLNCIARTIARAAIQQITSSVVNWINSGFNGQPSFVTNYKQFFTNIADQAAGEFIRGSALSFLCSPFQMKVRIAVAQSYARRNNTPSCTLSGATKNITNFANGNFSQGGWGGLVSLTGTPTNNAFGAYSYGQSELARVQLQATGIKQQDYIIGKGFLSSEKEVCNGPVVDGKKTGCVKNITTPGSTIAESLNKTLGVGQDSLNLAKSFDEIISALITQLMVKTLQAGLSSLSGTQGYASNFLTPEQQQAQADAQALLTDMQGRVNLAQQYGAVWQGAIGDIQNTQSQLQAVANCWEIASSTPDISSDKQHTAQANAANATAALHYYDPQVDLYNSNITRANQGITTLQNLQTRAIGVTSAGDVASVSADYKQALASGAIITEADITNAQQDRATLQSVLTLRNNQTASELQQCHAFK